MWNFNTEFDILKTILPSDNLQNISEKWRQIFHWEGLEDGQKPQWNIGSDFILGERLYIATDFKESLQPKK